MEYLYFHAVFIQYLYFHCSIHSVFILSLQYSFSIYTFIAVLIHGVFILSCRVHSSYICMQQLWRLSIIPVYKNVFWISKNIKILHFLNVEFVVEGKVLTIIRFIICMYIVYLENLLLLISVTPLLPHFIVVCSSCVEITKK